MAAILFNGAEPLRLSWISYRHNFSSFRPRSHPVATEQVSAQSDQRFGKMLKTDFQDGSCGGHLGFSIRSFNYFVSTKLPNAHHHVSIQLDYRDVQNMNFQHFHI